MKTCAKCHANKPLPEFRADRTSKGGYRNICIACNRAIVAAWQKANPERANATKRGWEAKNKDLVNARKRERSSEPEVVAKQAARNQAYYSANKEDILRRNRAWRVENPDAMRAVRDKRRAREASATGSYTANDVRALMVFQKCRCIACKQSLKSGYHVDHVIPLALGGSNDKSNIQLLCPRCNISKGAKHPVDFMQRNGFLL